MTKKKWAKKVVLKAARKAAEQAAKKVVKELTRKPVRRRSRRPANSGIGETTYDPETGNYVTACRLDGHDVEVYLDANERPGDVEELKRVADETIRAWPTLLDELCRIARKEIVASKGLTEGDVGEISPEDVTPFSLTIVSQRDADPYWSFGLYVDSEWLGDEEYVDVCRAVDGEWTTSEVCCTE